MTDKPLSNHHYNPVKRRKAAVKAAKTRKANALAKKRSEAALKAWDTRRAMALAKSRSKAAKKAWKTRRQNNEG